MACAEELSDFQRDTVIGCLLSNKSVQISALLELPWSLCCYYEVEMSRSNNGSAAKW
jgi:hypothetical protein